MAALALAATAIAAHAEHFSYRINLSGTYALGGPDQCTEIDQSGCPQPGTLTGTMSFDTPGSADGGYAIDGSFGDVTNFYVSLGGMPGDVLFGEVDLFGSVPSGVVQSLDMTEYFLFDAGAGTASYSYDYGYHNPNGAFTGTLSAIPEPATVLLLLAGVVGLVGRRGHRRAAASR